MFKFKPFSNITGLCVPGSRKKMGVAIAVLACFVVTFLLPEILILAHNHDHDHDSDSVNNNCAVCWQVVDAEKFRAQFVPAVASAQLDFGSLSAISQISKPNFSQVGRLSPVILNVRLNN
jgi:hypothetical protein